MEPDLVLLEALLGVQGRGHAVALHQLQEVESIVQALEALGGVPNPRTFVGVDSFHIFQEVYLRTDDPRVVNVVRFSESVGDLKVEPAVVAGQVPRHYNSEPKGCAQPQQPAQELSVVALKESTIFSNPCSIKGTLDIERSC